MISVKLKFRVSSLIKNEGTLYFQFIYKRKVKQVSTPYHIYEWEWDKDSEDIINLTKVSLDRIEIIKSIRENVIWEKNRIKSIIENIKNNNRIFSVDDIIDAYRNSLESKTSVFEYIRSRIYFLKDAKRERTSETYRQMLLSFMKFRNNKDLYFDMIDDKLICQYESYLKASNLCRNTTSFYMRTLRSVYNQAVEEGLSKQSAPFKHVYTGVDKTSKRAISLNEIRKIKKDKWLIILLVGLLLVVIAMPVSDIKSDQTQDEQQVQKAENALEDTYTDALETRLENALAKVEGVGNVKVMITLASSSEKVVEKDQEMTSEVQEGENGGKNTSSSETAIYANGNGEETPYVKQELSPRIEGVLVIADGGDNAIVIENITEAVQALFGVDTHKIKVMKHN